jgi:hypothetical protein
MTVQLNHAILWCRNKQQSAAAFPPLDTWADG